MANTYLHKLKAKFNNGFYSDRLPLKLQRHYDRHNFKIGYFKSIRISKREKQADKELKNELNNN